MKILNYTSNTLTLRNENGEDMVLPSLGEPTVIRSSTLRGGVFVPLCGDICDFDGLPETERDTILVVDPWVFQAMVQGDMDRSDVFCPGVRPGDGAVYEDGRLVAVTRLVKG